MKRKPGIAKLKKALWKEFTLYIKYQYADGNYCRCFTCDAVMEIGTSNCQGGHFINKKACPVHYFNEDNVRPQCYRCNINLSGNTVEFRIRLIEEIGEDRVLDMEYTRHALCKRSRAWYEERIAHYRELNKTLRAAA